MNNELNISIFSKALYSSWCYVPQHKILFDCGEGAATAIGNSLANIERIFIGHNHGDHTLGLPSIVGCRNSGRGISRNKDTQDHNKSLTIYYPKDNTHLNALFDFVMGRNSNYLRYKITFVPIEAGFELDLGNKQYVRAFNMSHQKNVSTLGYVIYENRNRLKPEFLGKNIPELLKNGLSKDAINESYRANIFAYCLDAYNIPDAYQLTGCKDVIMDCTFVNAEDRDDTTHFTIDEAFKLCKDVGIKKMYAAHLSGRYDYNEVAKNYPDITFINPYKVNHL